tara:strand:+ start:2533 stop:4965 length:2433 start_codon:yes stop_codon:yes gene_type:complete
MVKLIKLQGDSDKSNTRIRNIFNDGIIIPPNSKIGLRSCRVNFLNIQDFESFTLPPDTVIEIDYHVGDVSGSSPPMFVQKVVVPTTDASGAQIIYESSNQLLTALSKQSNATYSNIPAFTTDPQIKYQGFHNIWDLTKGDINAGRSEFITYSIPDKTVGFATGNGEFVKKSPADATNVTMSNGTIGITATTASPLSDNLNVEGQQSVPLVNTVLTGTMQVLPANDPALGDDCFTFAAKKGSGDLSSHPALWGWGISKDHNSDRRYALWVNDVKYFFPDTEAIVPLIDDQIQCRKFGEKIRFDVIRGGSGLPLTLGTNPVASNGGTPDLTITVPTGSGAHAGNTVVLGGFVDIPRPVQNLATDGVETSPTTVNLISEAGVEVLAAGADPSVSVTTETPHGLLVGNTFTMSEVTVSAGQTDIGGIPINFFNGPTFTVTVVDSVNELRYTMTGQTSTQGSFWGSGPGGKVITTTSNQDPLTLTFFDAHDLEVGEFFTMIPSVTVDGVTIGAGSPHEVQSAPSDTTITIAMPAGQTATNGGISGGGAAMTIQATEVLVSAAFLNKSHTITGVPTATTITIDTENEEQLEFTQTGGGASGTAVFNRYPIAKMISNSANNGAQSGKVPSLTSDSLDPQIVRWQVTADKATGFKVNNMTYQASAGLGQLIAVGLTINTTLAFPRDNPIGSYIGFVDSLYSNIGAPSIITSDQTAIGRNAYPAILVQSLKGLDLDSYAGKQDAPNKPISFFDVIVPQSVSTISNMIYEPNNIAMLSLHNAKPIELKDMEIQFARDDTGNPLRFFGQPTVVLELDEGCC